MVGGGVQSVLPQRHTVCHQAWCDGAANAGEPLARGDGYAPSALPHLPVCDRPPAHHPTRLPIRPLAHPQPLRTHLLARSSCLVTSPPLARPHTLTPRASAYPRALSHGFSPSPARVPRAAPRHSPRVCAPTFPTPPSARRVTRAPPSLPPPPQPTHALLCGARRAPRAHQPRSPRPAPHRRDWLAYPSPSPRQSPRPTHPQPSSYALPPPWP